MQRFRKLAYEALEDRQLMAVTASYSPITGDLHVEGNGDLITVTESPDGTLWEVKATNSSTSIVLPKPIEADVYITTGRSGDSIEMRGINYGLGPNAHWFEGRVFIFTGDGNDSVYLGSFEPPRPGDFNFINEGDRTGFNGNYFKSGVFIQLTSGYSASGNDSSNTVIVVNSLFDGSIGGRLDIEANGGANWVTLRGLKVTGVSNFGGPEFGGAVDIRLANGSDIVRIGDSEPQATLEQNGVQIGGDLNIAVGHGDNSVVLQNALVAGSIVVNSGRGDDAIRFGNVPGGFPVLNSAGRDIVINGGDGSDTVTVHHVTTGNSFLVDIGDSLSNLGNKLVVWNSSFSNDVAFLGGGQVDAIELRAVNIVTNLYIQTGGSNDLLDLQGTLVTAGLLTISTSAGNDSVRTDNSVIRSVALLSGDGDDSATLTANVIDDLFADLGPGNDFINSESAYRGRAFVRGGAGVNRSMGTNFLQWPSFTFEGF